MSTHDPGHRLLVGVHISKGPGAAPAWLDAVASDGHTRRFDNDAAGHCAFAAWLRKPAHVVVEATGTYGLDPSLQRREGALAPHADPRCEVMVANPRLIKGFAKALAQRSKTDAADAKTILAFAPPAPGRGQRMQFEPWSPPDPA